MQRPSDPFVMALIETRLGHKLYPVQGNNLPSRGDRVPGIRIRTVRNAMPLTTVSSKD